MLSVRPQKMEHTRGGSVGHLIVCVLVLIVSPWAATALCAGAHGRLPGRGQWPSAGHFFFSPPLPPLQRCAVDRLQLRGGEGQLGEEGEGGNLVQQEGGEGEHGALSTHDAEEKPPQEEQNKDTEWEPEAQNQAKETQHSTPVVEQEPPAPSPVAVAAVSPEDEGGNGDGGRGDSSYEIADAGDDILGIMYFAVGKFFWSVVGFGLGAWIASYGPKHYCIGEGKEQDEDNEFYRAVLGVDLPYP